MANFSNYNTKFIVIKSTGDSGKTTTVWVTLLKLLNQGATVVSFSNTYNGNPLIVPTALPASNNRYDFVAEVLFNNKHIVLMSMGDVAAVVDAELQKILPKFPDVVICASRSQYRSDSTWELFETKYTNLLYDRICLWSEYAQDPLKEVRVKEPTVEAIIKYIS